MIDRSFAIRRNLKFIDLAYLYLGKLNTAQNAAVNLTILDEDIPQLYCYGSGSRFRCGYGC